MRTIRFRGWSPDGGRWAYGDLIHGMDVDTKEQNDDLYIVETVDGAVRSTNVDPESVGQMINADGLRNVRFFEGDVVLVHKGGEEVIRYLEYDKEAYAFVRNDGLPFVDVYDGHGDYVKLIGNLYENPGLKKYCEF